MDLTIEQSCPSCGASIVLCEDDRLIQCAFCGVHNYKPGGVGSRYVLPAVLPDDFEEDRLIYVPYLRFKGSIFYVRDNEVKHKIVDTTRLGLDNRQLPVSLGLRPQAMRIKPVVSSIHGAFLIQSVPTKTVFRYAVMVADLFSDSTQKNTYHRAFIGETISRIYQPCYVKDEQLIDAVGQSVIGESALLQKHLPNRCSSKVSWEPHFITTICPGCGGLLSGEHDSLVLQCENCESLWQERNNRFIPLEWKVVKSDDASARYLPFWQITVSSQGVVLNSFGDYLRFTNQPLVVLQKYDKLPLVFWVPAFKINPKAFLQIASQLTVAQTRIPQEQTGQTMRVANGYPVTLDRQEAVQSIKSVLANTILNKEKVFPLLPKLRLSASHCELTYLPFVSQAHDLVQEHTHAAVQTAALRYGRSL